MSLTREQHIEQHEGQLQGLKAQKQELSDLRKLVNSPLFRKVILDRFCTEECARYVRMSVDMALSPESRADALAKAQAAGHLLTWITVEERMSAGVDDNIANVEAALEHLRTAPDEEFEHGIETL